MNSRELILLSPYRLPAKDSLFLSDEDVASFLNGYTALWHPSVLRGASDPPRIASPYDYETPSAGHVYAIPETPPMFLPDDWDQRVEQAGAMAFRAGSDREIAVANALEVLRKSSAEPLANISLEAIRPFFGIGFGYAHLVALFEAMDHDNILATAEFWQDMQQAAETILNGDADTCQMHLQSAANRLLAAREGLYPVSIHLVDLCLFDEYQVDGRLPRAYDLNSPLNLITSGERLDTLAHTVPDRLSAFRERIQTQQLEICLGAYCEREDPLLPLESQLWNLRKGLAVVQDKLGQEVRTYARRRFSAHPNLPLLLSSVGLQRGLLVSFDETSLPSFRTAVVNWPAADGRQIELFTRTPYRADSPQTYFHIAHYLNQTIAQDHAATLSLLHRGAAELPWYGDWLELSKLAPVFGHWTTISDYFNQVMAGEQASSTADDFHADYLTIRTDAHVSHPVSSFARHARLRRRLDTTWTLAALHRGLAGASDTLRLESSLAELEDKLESSFTTADENLPTSLADLQSTVLTSLAERLLSRAPANSPGLLILNPCSFARRVALEVDGIDGALPIEGPLKACQVDDGKARLVVEVPALGFAWVPRRSQPGTAAQAKRMKLADDRHVRNEFFEAEIDPTTGGLRGFWDHRTRNSRVGQQMIYNPGGKVHCSSVKVTSTGPALGEVVSEGAILDDHDQILTKFRQRFRAWLGRPVLEIRLELYPEHKPTGYAWHSYYGARFAWRDERTVLLRGVNGSSLITSHTRPDAPDYLEWRLGKQSTVLFPGNLPFQQRHGARMLDVILVPEGETCQVFDLALALDREQPMQTAFGIVTPVPMIEVAKGPPHVGSAGWLFHLDAPNVLLTGLRPASDGADAIVARMLEYSQHYTQAEFRCVRNPTRATLLDARGEYRSEASISGDAAQFELSPGDFAQLKVEFSG